jgi:hypothetical protein
MHSISTTTGEVFLAYSYTGGFTPTFKLASDHPFRPFWRQFLHNITTPGACDELIDCYVSVFLSNYEWKANPLFVHIYRQYVRAQLRNHPPDIILVEHHRTNCYGFHVPGPGTWSHICIMQRWVDEWTNVMHLPEERQALCLEVVLKGALVHELAHWHHIVGWNTWYMLRDTLGAHPGANGRPSIGMNSRNDAQLEFRQMTFGTFRTYPHTQNIVKWEDLPLQEFRWRLRYPPQVVQYETKPHMSDAMGVVWNDYMGEAGNFVEVHAGGGIIGYHDQRKEGTLYFYFYFCGR